MFKLSPKEVFQAISNFLEIKCSNARVHESFNLSQSLQPLILNVEVVKLTNHSFVRNHQLQKYCFEKL